MIARFLGLMIGVAATLLLGTLWVANSHQVTVVLDPFNPTEPVVALEVTLFVLLAFHLIVGVLLGGFAMWVSQGKWRKLARTRTQEAARWKGEAERLMRERDANVVETKKRLAIARG